MRMWLLEKATQQWTAFIHASLLLWQNHGKSQWLSWIFRNNDVTLIVTHWLVENNNTVGTCGSDNNVNISGVLFFSTFPWSTEFIPGWWRAKTWWACRAKYWACSDFEDSCSYLFSVDPLLTWNELDMVILGSIMSTTLGVTHSIKDGQHKDSKSRKISSKPLKIFYYPVDIIKRQSSDGKLLWVLVSASLHSIFLIVFPHCQYLVVDADAIQKCKGNLTHMVTMMHKVFNSLLNNML